MADQNGGGEALTAQEAIVAGGPESSLDGFAPAEPPGPLADRPELLIGGAFVAGLLLAALVSRIGR
jgi:hypothetical protein